MISYGEKQQGREAGGNLADQPHSSGETASSLTSAHKGPSPLQYSRQVVPAFGCGRARVAEIFTTLLLSIVCTIQLLKCEWDAGSRRPFPARRWWILLGRNRPRVPLGSSPWCHQEGSQGWPKASLPSGLCLPRLRLGALPGQGHHFRLSVGYRVAPFWTSMACPQSLRVQPEGLWHSRQGQCFLRGGGHKHEGSPLQERSMGTPSLPSWSISLKVHI